MGITTRKKSPGNRRLAPSLSACLQKFSNDRPRGCGATTLLAGLALLLCQCTTIYRDSNDQIGDEATRSVANPPLVAPPTPEAALATPQVMYVKGYYLNVRTGPGRQFATVATVFFNQPVTVYAVTPHGNWLKIGPAQYIPGKYVGTTRHQRVWVPSHWQP